jgi:hypothetical protein
MTDLAREQIAVTMWRWTADAVDTEKRVVKKDAYKYDFDIHAATKSAKATKTKKGLRHEHAVPRMVLARLIIDLDLPVDGIFKLLDRLCVAVVVTRAEDLKLKPRNKMPDGWKWENGDPYERYKFSGIFDELEFPNGSRQSRTHC